MTMTMTMPETQVTRQRVEWATVPRVNLLPPEIVAARSFQRTKRRLAGVVGGVVVVAAAGTFWAQRDAGSAQDELTTVTAQTSVLKAEERRYAEVPKVLAQLDSAQAARAQAMGSDVLWFRFLDELAADSPSGVLLESMTVTVSSGGPGAAADALTPSGYGDVKVTGHAKAYADVAKWLNAAVNVSGMEVSRLQTAQLTDKSAPNKPVDFSADVRIAESALSHRYDRKAE